MKTTILTIAAFFLSAASFFLLTPKGVAAVEKNTPWTAQQTSCSNQASTGKSELSTEENIPFVGEGSIKFDIGENGDTFVAIRHSGYQGVKLSEVTELSYSTFIAHSTTAQAPYIVLNVDINNDNALDDLLFFKPAYQEGSYNPDIATQSALTLKTWQTWDAKIGGWWSLEGYAEATPAAGIKPLSTYIEKNPEARIVNAVDGSGGVRIAVGCDSSWNGFVGYVDNVIIGVRGASTSYNFEPVEASPSPIPVNSPRPSPATEDKPQTLIQKATGFLGKLFSINR